MASDKILFVLTNHDKLGSTGKPTGYYVPEAAHPWRVLTDAGYSIDYASPQGGHVPPIAADEADPVQAAFLADEVVQVALENTISTADANPDSYAAILLVGGHGTMWDFPDDQALQALIANIYERGGAVSAVCHGPAGLVNVRLSGGEYLVAGRDVASFTDAEERAAGNDAIVPFLLASTLEARGARHHAGDNWSEQVIVDGRLITGQNPQSGAAMAERLVEVLAA